MNNICFIIAHKYVRGYPSYVKHYINNVKAAYGDEALVIITDNNSEHKDDIFDQLKDLEGVILLDNNIESKFMKSEKTTSPLKQPQAKGGSIKKQYGYMGGGKVYPQPRTARKTV